MKAIDFSQERYRRIRERFEGWWNGTNRTPIIGASIRERAPQGREPTVPYLSQATVDLETPVDKILDSIEYELSQYEFYGDAFPFYNMDAFGPGLLAAFLGAKLDNSTGRVWFHRQEEVAPENLHFQLKEDNPWLQRVISIYKGANERFEGLVRFGMPDLGGILDVLSTFYPGEELLLLLYDDPENVKRLSNELCEVWHKAYDLIAKAAKFDQFGYTDWSGIYSAKPSYVIQCDFSYMIGNDMFREFAEPGLRYQCKKLDRTIYHLDGINELQHLDTLLAIEDLNAIQWVPGEGQKPVDEWPEVYRKIADAGKGMQFLCWGMDKFAGMIEKIGNAGKFLYQYNYCAYPAESKATVLKCLKKLGVEK